MKCKKVQELILTDYLDDQMKNNKKVRLEEHMARCSACKEFFLAAGKVGNELFSKAGKDEAPELVWRRVKEAVITEQQKKAVFPYKVFEKIKYAFYIPNPALAFVTILALVVIFGAITKLMVHNQYLFRTGVQEQIEYLDYSADALTDVSASDETGLGTSIEKYFL